jgi:cellulose biosynthesis protein BcsQ
MSEALAEGMTVIDYAPNSPAAEDIISLVTWIRTTSVAVSAVHRGVRWSER